MGLRAAAPIAALFVTSACTTVLVQDDDGAEGGHTSSASPDATTGPDPSPCHDGPDLCDGFDSDCDGEVDEDDPVGGTACATELHGPCSAGTWRCAEGFPVCEPDEAPAPEVCDRVDNDCNGEVDDAVICAAKRVFVSSVATQGDFGGLDGADKFCQDLADVAGLGGSYKAWLSSADETAASRMAHATVPYVRVDGATLAEDWDHFIDGGLAVPIEVNELGGPAPEGSACPDAAGFGPRVWTGTTFSGELHTAGQTCVGWAALQGTGTVGCAGTNGEAWSICCSAPPCSDTAALYCVEQ